MQIPQEASYFLSQVQFVRGLCTNPILSYVWFESPVVFPGRLYCLSFADMEQSHMQANSNVYYVD